jgi:hypothetical protein
MCGYTLFYGSLLQYENMPNAAQLKLDTKSLESVQGVSPKVCQFSCCGMIQLCKNPVTYYKEVICSSAMSNERK